ncbi:oxidoreductase [Athelia psychrophila]|uniref:3-dehydrosphinganine reductase n=1 Tax=Athelia psychrophila TaxID=1759441 RepID=A0A166VRA8_9AGAM|nr:oxidoreductase [Fibularhizoctonia sp. CBS 109695]
MFGSKKWDPKGQHCYVTGGSAGLGLALAIHLVKKGADVSIVARNEGRLKKALEDLEAARQTPNQILKSYAFSMSDLASSKAALDAACAPHGGRSPHAMFLCAGMSRPGFFIEETEGTMRDGMDGGYWVQAFSALAGSQRMVADRTRGKIIFVSSLLGYMSIVGYSTYAPAKHALRGLAETLRSELALYDIGVHIFFPATIYSPGYAEENKSKPKITLKIEEGDEGLKPEQSAATLLSGVENGNFHITSDLQAHLFRAATRGASPMNNVLLDGLYAFIGWIGITIWRMTVDNQIIAHRAEHEQYLKRKGYFTVSK